MNNLLIYSFFMLSLFMVTIFIGLVSYLMDIGIFLEWMIFSVNSINLEFILVLDWMTFLFVSVVMLISSMVLLYSCSYMSKEIFINRFVFLVILFIFSMILMIISPNLISILFGWDGLGLVSYCLVIYYQNYLSYNSGMMTVLCNRLGDIGLLMSIGLLMMQGSWNEYYMMNSKLICLLIILAAITKSAQVPFSSWLPSAMAAPTPVSSLVHSSTLVTAGVYLMIRFNQFLMITHMCFYLFYLSVITMFMSSLMANFENDLKKIIALSTLSQLGLMMMILSLGLKILTFYHLLTHAIFKSLLFLCAGMIIHSMNNNQDIRDYGNLSEYLPFVMISFYISSLALGGYPFLAGFYSKDLIMEMIYLNKVNMLMLVMILMSLIFTVSYSFRLIYFTYFGEMNFISMFDLKENLLMNLSMIILNFLSIILGSLLMWLFFFDFKLIFLKFEIKILTLMMCLLGLILGLYLYIKKLVKIYLMLLFFNSMWFLNFMYLIVYKPILKISYEFEIMDKTWVEYTGKLMYMGMMKNMIKINNKELKMFMYVMMFIVILIMMIMN